MAIEMNSTHSLALNQRASVTEFQTAFAVKSAQIKKLESRLRLEREYFNIMQEFSNDILFRLNLKTKTMILHQSSAKLFGMPTDLENFPESERAKKILHPDDLEVYLNYGKMMLQGVAGSQKFRMRIVNGDYETFLAHSKTFCDEDGNPIEMLGKLENIQKYIDLEKKSQIDTLTGALNKHSFEEKVKEQLALYPRENSALFFIDLDDFKSINDRYGHSFGDFVLRTVGKKLRNNIRDTDSMGRVGGDEFTLFLPHVPTGEVVLEKAQRILASLNQEFSHENVSMNIHASIGIAVFPNHGDSYETLYQNADTALYMSKEQGKNIATLYHPSLHHQKKA